MSTNEFSLSDFLSGCEGKWQNAIYIPCGRCRRPCRIRQQGCLMSAALSGEPIIISVNQYEKLSGQLVDPSKCVGTISHAAFDSAFSRYLLWQKEASGECSLRKLGQKIQQDPIPFIKPTK